MASAKFKVKINAPKCATIDKEAQKALFLTIEAVHTDVVQAQVMPFDTGNMQNESTFVEKVDDTHVRLVTATPYAERLYFHPEYDFSKASNPNAQGEWLEPWISGAKASFIKDTFSELLAKGAGL